MGGLPSKGGSRIGGTAQREQSKVPELACPVLPRRDVHLVLSDPGPVGELFGKDGIAGVEGVPLSSTHQADELGHVAQPVIEGHVMAPEYERSRRRVMPRPS